MGKTKENRDAPQRENNIHGVVLVVTWGGLWRPWLGKHLGKVLGHQDEWEEGAWLVHGVG